MAYTMKVDEKAHKVVIEIDVSPEALRSAPLSKSGKSYLVASTRGPQGVIASGNELEIALNCYRSAPADDLDALKRQHAVLLLNRPGAADGEAVNKWNERCSTLKAAIDALQVGTDARDANHAQRTADAQGDEPQQQAVG